MINLDIINRDLFNVNFNSNMIIGLVCLAAGFSLLYNFMHARGGGRFKGKIPLCIVSAAVTVFGLFIFITGWKYGLR